jgi:hypothetical protein
MHDAMNQVAKLLRRQPRASAALGFGAAGAAVAMLWWSPVILHARGLAPFLLFIVTPGVSAAVTGWGLGKPLLDSAGVYRPRKAALRGAVIGSLALLLFAPLFATLYVLSQPATEALGHSWPSFPRACRKRARSLVACGADGCSGGFGAKSLGNKR